jgi:hypothetical protein
VARSVGLALDPMDDGVAWPVEGQVRPQNRHRSTKHSHGGRLSVLRAGGRPTGGVPRASGVVVLSHFV